MTISELLKNIEKMKSVYDFDVDKTEIKVTKDMRAYRDVIELYTIDKESDVAVRLVRSVEEDDTSERF